MPTYLYSIEPVREDMPVAPTDDEARLVGAHFAYLQDGYASGKVLFVGRTDEAPWLGIAIFEAADAEAAEAFLAGDPAVAGGAFRGRTRLFRTILPFHA